MGIGIDDDLVRHGGHVDQLLLDHRASDRLALAG
jgi:hypothetical protein